MSGLEGGRGLVWSDPVDRPETRNPDEPAHVAAAFATTHWSIVLSAGARSSAESDRALETLCRVYWPAVYSYIRRSGQDPESARDLTQEFFARLLEKGWLEGVDPARGRFRAFLRTVVQRFLIDEFHRGQRQKRGGGRTLVSLDEMIAEESRPLVLAGGRTPDEEFDRRWALTVVERCFQQLAREAEAAGQGRLFEAVQGLLTGGEGSAPLSELAAEHGLGLSALKMRIHRWRIRLRELLLSEVAQTVPTVGDLDGEVRELQRALAGG